MNGSLDDALGRLDALEARVAALEEKLSPQAVEKAASRPMSINEFKQNHQASTHTEKSLLIGYFLEFHEGMDEFTLQDIREGYKRCRWSMPKNLSDVLRRVSGKGHIMEIGEEDRTKIWRLTETGIVEVESELRKVD